jgi:hypothetical protein
MQATPDLRAAEVDYACCRVAGFDGGPPWLLLKVLPALFTIAEDEPVRLTPAG